MSYSLVKNTLHPYKPCSLYIAALTNNTEILLNKGKPSFELVEIHIPDHLSFLWCDSALHPA